MNTMIISVNLDFPSIDWEGGVFPHEASNDVSSPRDWGQEHVGFYVPCKSIYDINEWFGIVMGRG